ncbi:hypothetical protein B0H14DRAFT_2296728, partial [Mycena olivaceomarginata]
IDVAHGLCDPVNKARTLHLLDPATNILRVPLPSELVLPTIYRYQPLPGTTLLLTKHSERQNKSVTESTGVASSMRRQVLKRDNDTCWITGYNDSSVVINSHILPKRMDDAMARRLLDDFCAIPLGQQSVYDPIFGLTLFTGLDKRFYPYNLGFRKVA